jgi:hypothetical protein
VLGSCRTSFVHGLDDRNVTRIRIPSAGSHGFGESRVPKHQREWCVRLGASEPRRRVANCRFASVRGCSVAGFLSIVFHTTSPNPLLVAVIEATVDCSGMSDAFQVKLAVHRRLERRQLTARVGIGRCRPRRTSTVGFGTGSLTRKAALRLGTFVGRGARPGGPLKAPYAVNANWQCHSLTRHQLTDPCVPSVERRGVLVVVAG